MGTRKQLAVLGSTGSIGRQTLEVVRALPDRFCIVGLAAGGNMDLLAEQVAEFKPKFVSYQDEMAHLPDTGSEFLSLEEMARHPLVDTVLIATSGYSGLNPTMAAVKAGKIIALANKESLVAAGEIIVSEANKTGAQILPVDSEHSAIWQCVHGERQKTKQIILTASGGPFRHHSPSRLAEVTVEQALKHPSWQMGNKVTIDSATLMNKGLEVIEAHWLFNMPYANISVIIHPQSIIHSMVEFIDNSVKAQLSCPDMRLPIQYALSYPERLANPQLPRLDWDTTSNLTFEQPDLDNFPCLKLAIWAGKEGGSCPAVLCAADEVAVDLFLSGRIKFTDIANLVEETLEQHRATAHPNLEEIMAADAWSREKVLQITSRDYP
ncbi:1-deoxy-D-xylulose-5-phosphate reductoisomerase [Chloroflexota bacterium]